MITSLNKSNINKYGAVHTATIIEEASPHRLIQMLMEGFLSRVNAAKGAIERKDYEVKSQQISKAVAIVGGLLDGVDYENGGEIAANLANLYNYINERLFQASVENDIGILDEVGGLMRELKTAWDAIPEMYQQ